MRNGFIKVAAGTPSIRVADCEYNAEQIIQMMKQASMQDVRVLVLPELCVTGYTCSDLFLHQKLLDGVEQAVQTIVQASTELDLLVLIGAPLQQVDKLYNCAVVVYRGKILGAVPKSHLPTYGEFYEMRQFTPAPAENGTVTICGREIPFGTKLLFACQEMPNFRLGVEICEDLWVPNPPSVAHALAGATIVANLSASDELIGKSEYRRSLVLGQSARLLCGYVYADAGDGESTTDMVFAGHNLIAENGALLAEQEPFDNGLAVSEIDVDKLVHERRRMTTFQNEREASYQTISFSMELRPTGLTRCIAKNPFVPQSEAVREDRCDSILQMQVAGLKKRLEHSHAKTAVVGISGGLDSCLALLVAVYAMDALNRPRTDVVAVTMPCFGTTQRTKGNAEKLTTLLGATLRCVDIKAAVTQHLQDIGHPDDVLDVTYENAQARERTQVLMDMANQTGGMVIGTGDLSELALGWATYNGDHMSMYAVNASIPKTLVRYLVQYCADYASGEEDRKVLLDILDTPVSPELLPPEGETISQKTEELVGPYELHDFFLYYVLRWGFPPAKIFALAQYAFGEQYSPATILKWLQNFYRRFFAQQFKRSCLPDGPKVGTVTLSPRGDWRMPSDASARLWMQEIDKIGISAGISLTERGAIHESTSSGTDHSVRKWRI